MSPAILLLLALGLGLAGWLAARARAWTFRRSSADGRIVSLPNYHAWYVALWVVLPVLAFVALWSAIAPGLVSQSVLASPAAAEQKRDEHQARQDQTEQRERRKTLFRR